MKKICSSVLLLEMLFVLVSVSLLFVNGCKDIKTEKSDVMHEEGKVIVATHSPSRHDINIGKKMMDNPLDLGATDYSGRSGIAVGNVVISHTEVPEKFGVVFQCQHGEFTIEGSKPKHKALYNKLIGWQGKKVDITYMEMYRVTYEDKDEDGIKEETERVLVDLDFLDADKVEE